MPAKHNRRNFIRCTAAAVAGLGAAPLVCRTPLFGADAASKKLNIACIGLGGQMDGLMKGVVDLNHNVVALCDVDTNHITTYRKKLGAAGEKANAYKDYRVLLEKEKSLDAVIIATPDHWHAAIATAAIKAGKHVYCEKPLTHTIGEARQLASLAQQSKVVTQTGNQGSASANFRRSMELIRAGIIGPVHEVHLWHPRHGWPCAMATPTTADPIPEGLDWDFWLGPAPLRSYQKGIYHPAQWRGWFDFGGGSLADFCCHGFSMPVRALDLDYPERIEISGTPLGMDSFPKSCRVHFQFPARGQRGPVTIHFHTGGELPPPEVTAGMKETLDKVPETGCLVLGENGTMSAGLWNNECRIKMKGELSFNGTNHEAAKPVPQTLPRARGSHIQEWVEACQGDGKTFSPFEIGGHITEIGAAGVLALRLGRNLQWDGPGMKAEGTPEAAALVKAQHRGEWGL